MNLFEFTHSHTPDSTAVKGMWYNANNMQLALDLHETVYVYSGVGFNVYKEMTEADSAGSFYQTEIKGVFGSANSLGNKAWVKFNPVFDTSGFSAPALPDSLEYAGFDDEDEPDFDADYDDPPEDTWYSSTPEPELFNYEKEETSFKPTPQVSLSAQKVSVKPGNTSRYEVGFTHGDDETLRKYETQAQNTDDALEQLLKVSSMLGIPFNIRQVTVYFE